MKLRKIYICSQFPDRVPQADQALAPALVEGGVSSGVACVLWYLWAKEVNEAGDLDDPLREEFEYLVIECWDLGIDRPVVPIWVVPLVVLVTGYISGKSICTSLHSVFSIIADGVQPLWSLLVLNELGLPDMHEGEVLIRDDCRDVSVWAQILLLLVAHEVGLHVEVRLIRASCTTQVRVDKWWFV